MSRGGDLDNNLVTRRGARGSRKEESFLVNGNDFIAFPPDSLKAWMLDGELTDIAFGSDRERSGQEVLSDLQESPDLVHVILDTAELMHLDWQEKMKDPEEREAFFREASDSRWRDLSEAEREEVIRTPFFQLAAHLQEENILGAKSAYAAIARQGMRRPYAEIDDESLLEDRGFWIVDDVRDIKGKYEKVFNKSKALSGDSFHSLEMARRDAIKKDQPYMILTSDDVWVPFDLERAASDVHEAWRLRHRGDSDLSDSSLDVPYEELSEEEKEKDRQLIRNAILVQKRPLLVVETNGWSEISENPGGRVEKLLDPLGRLHNSYGPAITHYDEDGKVVRREFFENGREPRDGRVVGINSDGSREYWQGSYWDAPEDAGDEGMEINVYRIEDEDGIKEWWSHDGFFYRRLTPEGKEEFNDAATLALDSALPYRGTEKKNFLRALGYRDDEIAIVEDGGGQALVARKLEEYRKSKEYQEESQRLEKEGERRVEEEKKVTIHGNNLLYR